MKVSIPAMLLLIVASASARRLAAQSPNRPSEKPKLARTEERDSYDVYSDLLRVTKPDIATWTIIQETKDFTFCLKPAQNLDPSYRQVIDDYALKNQNKFILERMFSIPQYTLASPERWFDRGTSRMFAILSAVGFSVDRTRSGVCYSTGTAAGNSGTCLFLVKKDGKWQVDNGYRGDACGFGGAVYY
jgi:hypothetical protein